MVRGGLVIFPAKILSLNHKHIDWWQVSKGLGPFQIFIEVTFLGLKALVAELDL